MRLGELQREIGNKSEHFLYILFNHNFILLMSRKDTAVINGVHCVSYVGESGKPSSVQPDF